MISLAIYYIAVHDAYNYDAYNYGHCYSLCKQIKLLMSKILSIIGKKKRIAGKKNGKKKSKINWSLLTTTSHYVL